MSINHKELSEQIARLYWVVSWVEEFDYTGECVPKRHITQDIGAMMRLAIENDLCVMPDSKKNYVEVYLLKDNECTLYDGLIENYADHESPEIASCVAIANALIKLKDNQP